MAPSSLGTELRLISYIVGLYVCFIYWGYLQEKITSKPYTAVSGETLEWNYPFVLNLCMATASFFISYVLHLLSHSPSAVTKTGTAIQASFSTYWKAGLTCSLASPVGYASLKYITFPMMVLTKSSKPIPVMLMGVFLYKRSFPWYKYVSVLLVVGGICLFSSVKKESHATASSSGPASDSLSDSWSMVTGLALVLVNLVLDGYTNNEQDKIFSSYSVSPLQMMSNTNLWQSIFLVIYLLTSAVMIGASAELPSAVSMILSCPSVQYDIALFCICASLGQVMIFSVMKEFGSLAWITISITRKLFTILLSIFAFNHKVKMIQWAGVGLVFIGLLLETAMSYVAPKADKKEKKA